MTHALQAQGQRSLGLFLVLMMPAAAHAQTSHAEVDRTSVRLSESVCVTLSITGNAPLRVELASPLSSDSQAAWRVKRAEPAALTPLSDHRERWSQTFELDPWLAGDPLPLTFGKAKVLAGNNTEQDVGWKPFDIRVLSTISPRPDEARPVTGIEQLPAPPPTTPESFVWAFLLGAVLVVGVMVVVGFVRRSRRKPPPLPPLEWALAEFDRIERDGTSGEALADRVAAVLREFIARKFGVAAPKQTTAELLADANRAGWPPGLDGILGRCDRAKFAGESPTADEGHELVARARDWVEHASPPVTTGGNVEA